MKKVVRSRRNKGPQKVVDPFAHDNVIDYSQDMRVDPLTTTQDIEAEYKELEEKRSKREQEKAAKAAEIEAEKAESKKSKEEDKRSEDDDKDELVLP
jgi:proteasome assembly chaperone (PAC2) family protein